MRDFVERQAMVELPCIQPEADADAVSRTAILSYIDRLANQGTGKKKSLEFARKFVEKLQPVQPVMPEDAVSRQTVKEQMQKYGFHAPDMTITEFVEDCL